MSVSYCTSNPPLGDFTMRFTDAFDVIDDWMKMTSKPPDESVKQIIEWLQSHHQSHDVDYYYVQKHCDGQVYVAIAQSAELEISMMYEQNPNDVYWVVEYVVRTPDGPTATTRTPTVDPNDAWNRAFKGM